MRLKPQGLEELIDGTIPKYNIHISDTTADAFPKPLLRNGQPLSSVT